MNMFSKKLKVTQENEGSKSISGALGISDNRKKELDKIIKVSYASSDSVTESMALVTEKDNLTVNELAYCMFIIGTIKEGQDFKYSPNSVEAMMKDMLGYSKDGDDEYEEVDKDEVPEVILKANKEAKKYMYEAEVRGDDKDDIVKKIKEIFASYGLKAEIGKHASGISIAVNKEQIDESGKVKDAPVASSVDEALEKLSQAQKAGDDDLVQKLKKFLTDNN